MMMSKWLPAFGHGVEQAIGDVESAVLEVEVVLREGLQPEQVQAHYARRRVVRAYRTTPPTPSRHA